MWLKACSIGLQAKMGLCAECGCWSYQPGSALLSYSLTGAMRGKAACSITSQAQAAEPQLLQLLMIRAKRSLSMMMVPDPEDSCTVAGKPKTSLPAALQRLQSAGARACVEQCLTITGPRCCCQAAG